MLIFQMNHFKHVAVGIYFVTILGIAGAMDYQDEIYEHNFYIEAVCSGEVYDHKQLNPECL